jgi:hypothetical protein
MEMTKRLIHDLNYAQKYTSGVLSWAERPGEIDASILEEIMDSFESMVGVGIEPDRLNLLWVMHREKNRIELHWVIPNVDLQTGKRFAPYFDRTDRPRFRAWERYVNAKYDFADPSDPKRKRDLRLPSNLPKNKVTATEAIHSVVEGLITQGHIQCRNEIMQQLRNAGYKINRQGTDYISIEDESGQKLRLRGAFYEASFINIGSLAATVGSGRMSGKTCRTERIEELRSELERQLEKRSRYVENRCRQSELSVSSGTEESTWLGTKTNSNPAKVNRTGNKQAVEYYVEADKNSILNDSASSHIGSNFVLLDGSHQRHILQDSSRIYRKTEVPLRYGQAMDGLQRLSSTSISMQKRRKVANGRARKSINDCVEKDGTAAERPLRRIEFAIKELERAVTLFCRNCEQAITRITGIRRRIGGARRLRKSN